jgi:imidazoleglycerol phosphate dehydratase HisB
VRIGEDGFAGFIVVVKKTFRYSNVFFYNRLCRNSAIRNIIMKSGIITKNKRLKIMENVTEVERKTKETAIRVSLNLSGTGQSEISTGIPFFDHMLTLFAVHGFFDLGVKAKGDLEVDYHHTVEDLGLVLGDAFDQALESRKGIKRFGHAATPMDDALTAVTVDLSKRPFLVYNVPSLFKSFGRALDQAASIDERIKDVRSSKGTL